VVKGQGRVRVCCGARKRVSEWLCILCAAERGTSFFFSQFDFSSTQSESCGIFQVSVWEDGWVRDMAQRGWKGGEWHQDKGADDVLVNQRD